MATDIEQNVASKSTWTRALYMLLYALAYGLAEAVLGAVVIAQFLIVLFSGSVNKLLQQFGQQLSTYVYQIMRYVTFNTEYRPFPFNRWPDDRPVQQLEPRHG